MFFQARRAVWRRVADSTLVVRPGLLLDGEEDQQIGNDRRDAEGRGRQGVALLLGAPAAHHRIHDHRRGHGRGDRSQEVEEHPVAGQRGPLVVVRGDLGGQRMEGNDDQRLQRIAQGIGQHDIDHQQDLALDGRGPPQDEEGQPVGNGEDEQERAPATPTALGPVADDTDQGVVDGVPEDADQGGEGGQPGIQPDHVGQEDGIEDLAQGVESGQAPVARAVDDFGQPGQPSGLGEGHGVSFSAFNWPYSIRSRGGKSLPREGPFPGAVVLIDEGDAAVYHRLHPETRSPGHEASV